MSFNVLLNSAGIRGSAATIICKGANNKADIKGSKRISYIFYLYIYLSIYIYTYAQAYTYLHAYIHIYIHTSSIYIYVGIIILKNLVVNADKGRLRNTAH